MSFVLTLLISSAQAATITVDATGGGDFSSLQAAVDAAASDDRLVINSGTYAENISISGKNLNLEGAGSLTTTIWGDGSTGIEHQRRHGDRDRACDHERGGRHRSPRWKHHPR